MAAQDLNGQSAALKNVVERLAGMVGGDASRHRQPAAIPQRNRETASGPSPRRAAGGSKPGGQALSSTRVSAGTAKATFPGTPSAAPLHTR
jgi:hypothetical protein